MAKPTDNLEEIRVAELNVNDPVTGDPNKAQLMQI